MPSTEAACKQATRALAVAAPTVRAERVARLATRINEVKTNLAVRCQRSCMHCMIDAKGAFTADLKDMILGAKEAPPAELRSKAASYATRCGAKGGS